MILLLLLGLSLTATAQNCTPCGYMPTAAPCCGDCFTTDNLGYCVPTCGKSCKSDSECGPCPESPCAACIRGSCQGVADFGNCPQKNPWQPGQPIAPILPSGWSANFKIYNYMNSSDNGSGQIFYDYRFGGLRTDFYDQCPFVELQQASNDGPCTVLFYKGMNYYIYPQESFCCAYHFPVWAPDSYRVGNASFGGNMFINGQNVTYWRFEYSCPWVRPPVPSTRNRLPAGYTVQRDIYLLNNEIPFRMNETLTSAYSDFTSVQVGPQDESIFTELIEKFKCVGPTDPHFLRVCNKYNAQGRLGGLGFG